MIKPVFWFATRSDTKQQPKTLGRGLKLGVGSRGIVLCSENRAAYQLKNLGR